MPFTGFPKDTPHFLREAGQADKAWFEAHRAEYEAYYLKPARAFVEAMGPLLAFAPEVSAEPKVNKSIRHAGQKSH